MLFLVCLILFLSAKNLNCLTTNSLALDEGRCNVVNIHNYLDSPKDQPPPQRKQFAGAPGKRGPSGPPGPPGPLGRNCDECLEEIRLLKQKISENEASSCDELREQGTTESGFHQINPDIRKYQPFYVYCNFSSGETVTEIWHDTMEEIQISNCEDRACYSRSPSYNLPLLNIINLVENSRECRQYIKFRCQGVVLLNDKHGVPYGYWVSRNGETMRYWGGATSRRDGYCACGETGTCVDPTDRCNCDNNGEGLFTSDEGYITDKSKLPVTMLKFGDAGGARELGFHTLGKLECYGTYSTKQTQK